MSSSSTTETYAQWLRRQMDAGDWTLRGLAKELNPEDVENERRALRRYLKGMVPLDRNRKRIARALGTGDETGPGPDESEDD